MSLVIILCTVFLVTSAEETTHTGKQIILFNKIIYIVYKVFVYYFPIEVSHFPREPNLFRPKNSESAIKNNWEPVFKRHFVALNKCIVYILESSALVREDLAGSGTEENADTRK